MAKSKAELKIVVSNDPPEPPPVEMAPEQVEMPFAVVNGEPYTQLPRDLYIPPQALEVFLEAFEGPLDLLLYLIRKQNLDILDIPLAEITRQYMEYIELMEGMQLELAGEYMVMAATLAEIKSRMLLPRPKVDSDGVEDDPRAELVRRLQEYERFKKAAEEIDSLPRLERDVWQASAELVDRQVVRSLPHITLQEMLLAFKDVVIRSEMFAHHHISRERLSVRARMTDILTSLENSSFVEFIRLFRPSEGRMGVTVTFMAILELVREGLLDVVQAEPFAPLHVRSTSAARNLRVVSDNDAAVLEPAVTPVEVIIEDLPLDPNFIDDSEDSEDDDFPLPGIDEELKPAVEDKAPPAEDIPLEGEVGLPAAGDVTPAVEDVTFAVEGKAPAADLVSAVEFHERGDTPPSTSPDETLIVVEDLASGVEDLLPAVEEIPAEVNNEQVVDVAPALPAVEDKLPGVGVDLPTVGDLLPEVESEALVVEEAPVVVHDEPLLSVADVPPAAADKLLDVDDIPALVEDDLPPVDVSTVAMDDSLAEVDYGLPVVDDTPPEVSIQEMPLVEEATPASELAVVHDAPAGAEESFQPVELTAVDEVALELEDPSLVTDEVTPAAEDRLPGADELSSEAPPQLLDVDTLPPETNDELAGATVLHSVPHRTDDKSPVADDDLKGGDEESPSPDEASS